MKQGKIHLFICIAALSASISHASDIRWNGYANIVAGGLTETPYDLSQDKNKHLDRPGYLNYQKDLNFDSQSSAAIQVSKEIDPKSSITTQLFASGLDGDYVAKMKWLYITYNLDFSSMLRMGRLGAPLYYFSDFINVGYAYPWISPPSELYAYDTTFTGLDYTYRGYIESSDWSIEFFTGSADQQVFSSGMTANTGTRNLIGVNMNFSALGWLNIRSMVTQSNINLNISGLNDLVDSLPVSLQQKVGAKLDTQDFRATYSEFALRAEFDHLLLMAEATSSKTSPYINGDAMAWFGTGGIKFSRNIMVHLTYAENKTKMADAVYDDLAYLRSHTAPNPSHPSFGDYYAAYIGTQVATSIATNHHSWTLGSRYDIGSNIALKFDVTRFEEKPSITGELAGIGSNTMVRVALNSVY